MSDAYKPIIENLLETYAAPAICLYRPYPPVHPVEGLSKFGGLPNLPTEISWPRGVDPYAKHFRGRSDREWHDAPPLHFLAQIDCGELPDVNPALPEKGMLFFFARLDEECVWDDDAQPHDGTRVIYVADFDRDTPIRQPPEDIWPIGVRGSPAAMTLDDDAKQPMMRGPDRTVLNAQELVVVPEWPMKCAAFESYPDPQHFTYDPVDGVAPEDKYEFGKAYGAARSARVSENLVQATGIRLQPDTPPRNRSHYENLVHSAYEKLLWDHLPHNLKQRLPIIAAFPQNIAAHLCHAIIYRQKQLERDPNRGSATALTKLQKHLLQAETWMRLCARLDPGETLPEMMADGFVRFLDQVANDTYTFDTTQDGVVRPYTRELVSLLDPYIDAMMNVARLAASDGVLCHALPDGFFVYLDFLSQARNPLRSPSHDTPHQMLGHVLSCQNALSLDDGEVMLLHLYSDRALRFCWWDVGEVTFMIEAADLQERKFDRAWATIQG
ncbi:DUF1963 domain-containing protein [Yoonia sp. R2-816]|uniref:DUF1963 domain-containing protein n=1 Tax=Yoonia sp. R2-816 TaxID=3342638 RepID=UPI00372CB6F1